MKIVEIQVEDIPEMGVVEVYLMGEHVCSDQEPFHYQDRKTRTKARREALKRGQELAHQHDCKIGWNF